MGGWRDALPPPPKKSLHEGCRIDRCIVVKLICSLDHCEWNGHIVHKVSQRRLTADWLAPRESECSSVRSNVSSDWLPNYIKTTWPVVEIFKMDGYFPDSPHVYIYIYTGCHRRKGPNFGRVFLMLNYTDITQNIYVQSWTVSEIMSSEVWNLTAVTHLLITKFISKLAEICGFCNVNICT